MTDREEEQASGAAIRSLTTLFPDKFLIVLIGDNASGPNGEEGVAWTMLTNMMSSSMVAIQLNQFSLLMAQDEQIAENFQHHEGKLDA